MGRYRLPPDAWRQATLVLLRYPETRAQFMELIEESRTNTSERRNGGAKPSHPDPTATAAIRLYGDARFQRIKREVCAVEHALAGLSNAEREVIRRRFFDHKYGSRKVCGYQYMQDIGFGKRQMQRIVHRVVKAIAIQLGEI